ncbi:MAG: hypothetical protein SGI83_14935 [Bacteroidota bacterium]|nr:hypothetical protein [Bacteroidota bacterium]
MKQLQFLILLCSFTVVASAQNSFLLYSFKGNVSVVENNVEAKAKVGKPLNAGATVKVAAGSAVTLICNEAAMFTLTKAGTYPLSKFGDSCRVSSNSVSANYVKYVWASMTKSSGSAGSNRKAYMNTVGAVSRGGMNNVWIDNRLDTINYSSGNIFPLSWKSYAEAKDFEFSLYSNDNISTPIYSNMLTKLKISIGTFSGKMKQGNSYYWTAAIKGEENDDLKIINYVSKETFNAVLETIKLQGAAFEAPAEQAYRIAFMLEDAHYLSEAYQYYSKAATLDAANALYRSTLMSFKKDYEIK